VGIALEDLIVLWHKARSNVYCI